jgi:sorbose reductase
MWYNSSDRCIKLAEELSKEFNIKAKAYKVPLSSSSAIQDGVAQVERDFSRIDIVVAK